MGYPASHWARDINRSGSRKHSYDSFWTLFCLILEGTIDTLNIKLQLAFEPDVKVSGVWKDNKSFLPSPPLCLHHGVDSTDVMNVRSELPAAPSVSSQGRQVFVTCPTVRMDDWLKKKKKINKKIRRYVLYLHALRALDIVSTPLTVFVYQAERRR